MSKYIDFTTYNKDQAILTSGRLILNAREDNLFILAKKDVAMSMGGNMHINIGAKGSITSKLIINSGRVQFGLPGNSVAMEPVAKGDSTTSSINSLITELSTFLSVLTSAKGLVTGGIAELPSINLAAQAFNSRLSGMQKELDKIKSTTTFTN